MKRVLPISDLTERVLHVLRPKKKWAVAIIGVAMIGMFATAALGSHGSSMFGITGTQFFVMNGDLDYTVRLNSDRVKFQTKGATDVRVQKIVVGAGGFSGWHHHPGIVIVAVQSGDLTITHADCSSATYGPDQADGDVFVEGGDEPGQASSASGATLYVTFVAPDGAGFRIDDHAFVPPSCP